jgi:hypothetical protein
MKFEKVLLGILLGVALFTSSCASVSSAASTSRKVKITTTSLPSAIASQSYSQQLTASGGVGPYVWSVESGTLPPGITLGATGVISGRATALGQFTFTVLVVDSRTLASTRIQINLKG